MHNRRIKVVLSTKFDRKGWMNKRQRKSIINQNYTLFPIVLNKQTQTEYAAWLQFPGPATYSATSLLQDSGHRCYHFLSSVALTGIMQRLQLFEWKLRWTRLHMVNGWYPRPPPAIQPGINCYWVTPSLIEVTVQGKSLVYTNFRSRIICFCHQSFKCVFFALCIE